MRTLLCSVLFFSIGTTGAAQGLDYDEPAVKAFCAEEWKEDFAMQKFCIDQIADGHRDFGSLVTSEQDDTMLKALDRCRREWGIQWNMVAFCGEQQVSARSKLPTILSGIPEDVSSTIRTKCESEWPADFAMTAFCAEQNVSGWRQINQ